MLPAVNSADSSHGELGVVARICCRTVVSSASSLVLRAISALWYHFSALASLPSSGTCAQAHPLPDDCHPASSAHSPDWIFTCDCSAAGVAIVPSLYTPRPREPNGGLCTGRRRDVGVRRMSPPGVHSAASGIFFKSLSAKSACGWLDSCNRPAASISAPARPCPFWT